MIEYAIGAWKPVLAALAAAFFLAGCTAAQQAALTAGVEQIQKLSDGKAKLIKAATCAVELGAYFRIYTEVEQRAFDVLCGGQWERPVTADDVRALRELADLLRPAEPETVP